jgi:hypothetical protein
MLLQAINTADQNCIDNYYSWFLPYVTDIQGMSGNLQLISLLHFPPIAPLNAISILIKRVRSVQ